MENGAVQYYVITDDEIERLIRMSAEEASRKAIEVFEKKQQEMKGERRDKRLRNTRVLLRNYRMLLMNRDNSIYMRSQVEESAADILENMMNLYDDEVIIDSIKRSTTRTAIIVAHIENMLEIYHCYCYHTSGDELDIRRYEILYRHYIADEPEEITELAERFMVSSDTVYADLRIACERLSALIFGIDGLHWN